MALIGISGKIGSGKDTVGKYLQYLFSNEYPKHTFEEFLKYPRWVNGNDWQIKKYADKLKEIVCLLIGCTREQLEDIDFKNKELSEEWWYYIDPINMLTMHSYLTNKNSFEERFLIKPTPRILLQLLGTECGRQIIHPNCWINALFANYNPKHDNWCITDVRFPNEADAIKEQGGILIRLSRPISTNSHIAAHPSETALDNYDKFDYIIDNRGTEEELYVKLLLLQEELLNQLK